jgi:16S rRNA (adenine1518-N6/adenine1519-N6)-dimethyltransferase
VGAKLGQHFLRDDRAVALIVEASGAGPGRRILEIGPGKGALTLPLLKTGATVTAVEKDDQLAERLSDRLTVINEDFLRVELPPGLWRVVGNLPYAVATPILQKLLLWDGWDEAVLMFQREVANRICAPVGGADYGLLRLSVLLRAEAEVILGLQPSSFVPPPKVHSAVVRVKRLPKPLLGEKEERDFWRPVKAAFAQRRKMAAKTIAGTLGIDKEKVEDELEKLGLRRDARPETIPFEAWLALGRSLA